MCIDTNAFTPSTVRAIRSRNSSGWSGRQGSEPFEVVVEAEVEVHPLHLAIGDEVCPGPQLVVDGEADSVADHLGAIIRAVQFGMASDVLAELGVPAGEGPRPDDGGGQ